MSTSFRGLRMFIWRYLIVLAYVASYGTPSVHGQTEKIRFGRDIRPILSGHCFKCHGPDAESREADLRLDLRKNTIKLGAIVPSDSDAGGLIERVISDDPDLRMPPGGKPLSREKIEKLRLWIKQGAAYERHWSYVKPVLPKQPPVTNKSWPASQIDFFVLNKIEQLGFSPSPRAEPAVLLRRLCLDLTGMPPSVEEIKSFEASPSRKQYEAHVDRLLKSKHFGEKWAIHWLDLARYADSNGYQHDDLRSIWPYRDWVIQALNDDMPFDQFTIEQLAGDLLPNSTVSQRVATGFHRNVATNFSGGAKVPEVHVNIKHDRVTTTGLVWLGTTFECAQCHNHKFDAITQKEYYQLYAFFNQATPEVAMKGEKMFKKVFVGHEISVYAKETDKRRAEEIRHSITQEEKTLESKKRIARADQAAWELRFVKEDRAAMISWDQFPYNLRYGNRYLKKKLQDREEDEKRRIDTLLIYDHKTTKSHVKRIYQLQQELKRIAPKTMVMQDSLKPVATQIFIRGNFKTLGERVNAGVPAALHQFGRSFPRNRLGLAWWLVDPENPLTARVTVNRIWAEIFGQGIVTTPEDFGMQGEHPTHPELLDWLAIQFVEDSWSIKRLIKTIVMSTTYQQTSSTSPLMVAKDPKNQWYARGPRFRLSAEIVRDNLLTISGLVSRGIGGPPVYPVQPKGLWEEISGATETKYPTSSDGNRFRRGLYTIWRRGNPNPSMVNFDATSRSTCIIRRDRSNTPMQALTLLNDPTYVEMAGAFAKVIENGNGSDRGKAIRAFRKTLARRPTADEVQVLLQLYQKNKSWFDVVQTLFNLDETITKS